MADRLRLSHAAERLQQDILRRCSASVHDKVARLLRETRKTVHATARKAKPPRSPLRLIHPGSTTMQ